MHDSPTGQHAGTKFAHARLVHFRVFNLQDFTKARTVAMGHNGAVGHSHGNKNNARTGRHFFQQHLKAYPRLTAHAGAQNTFKGNDKRRSLFSQQTPHGSFTALNGNIGKQAYHEGQHKCCSSHQKTKWSAQHSPRAFQRGVKPSPRTFQHGWFRSARLFVFYTHTTGIAS